MISSLFVTSKHTQPYCYTCRGWNAGCWGSWCCRIAWNRSRRRGRRRPSCVVGRSSSYGVCSHETIWTANSPCQKPFASVVESSYRVPSQAQKSRDNAVQAGSSKPLFRVGSESRWWRLCRFGRLIRPIAAPIACRVALLSAKRRMPLTLCRASPYFRISP